MSYIVLARKWRPKRFADMVGQEHVLRALSNALDSGKVHHALLFTGTRGVGKTTVARILAKSLNCETGVRATPCGDCGACREIDAGRFVDLVEVDAASRTGVDDMRGLLDNVQYAPTRGRYKVYLIDEVHMLSKPAFNALLKTLEEPPPHVQFLLATTDPQKLPATVLSRCLQFSLKRLSANLIGERLKFIAAAETLDFEPAAIALLARAADGSMRDALSLMDQLVAFGGGVMNEANARFMLGTIDRGHVSRILDALARQDGAGLLAQVGELDRDAPDYDRALIELAAFLQRIAIVQVVPEAAGQDEEFDAETLTRLARDLAPEDAQLYYQIALNGRRDLALAPDPRLGFEMCLLRMLAFRPDSVTADEGRSPAAAAGARAAPPSAVTRPSASAPASPVAPTAGVPGPSHATPASPASPASNPTPALAAAAALAPAPTVAVTGPSAATPASPAAPASNPTPALAAAAALTPATTVAVTGPLPATPASPAAPASNPTPALAAAAALTPAPTAGVTGPSPATPPAPPAPALTATPTPPVSPVSAAPFAPAAARTQVAAALAGPPAASGTAAGPVTIDAGNWAAVVEAAKVTGWVRQFALNCVPAGFENQVLRLQFDKAAADRRSPQVEDKLAQGLSNYFGAQIRIAFESLGPALVTPARRRALDEQDRVLRAVAAFEEDPAVKGLCERFGAEIDAASVKPMN